MNKRIGKQNIGNAGEYYLASYLSAHDFTVTITLGRAEKFDLLCVTPDNKRTIKISVKTRFGNKKSFPLSIKDELGGQEDFYYAFIILNEYLEQPNFWIIPSKRVNYILKLTSDRYFNEWITKGGISPNDVGLRKLDFTTTKRTHLLYPDSWLDEVNEYEKNISQLSLDDIK